MPRRRQYGGGADGAAAADTTAPAAADPEGRPFSGATDEADAERLVFSLLGITVVALALRALMG